MHCTWPPKRLKDVAPISVLRVVGLNAFAPRGSAPDSAGELSLTALPRPSSCRIWERKDRSREGRWGKGEGSETKRTGRRLLRTKEGKGEERREVEQEETEHHHPKYFTFTTPLTLSFNFPFVRICFFILNVRAFYIFLYINWLMMIITNIPKTVFRIIWLSSVKTAKEKNSKKTKAFVISNFNSWQWRTCSRLFIVNNATVQEPAMMEIG